MANVPLSRGAYERSYAREPQIKLLNRFFETNPSNQEDGVSLIRRPPSTEVVDIGDGPVRTMYSLKGTFNDDLFVVSDRTLYRVDTNFNFTPILGTIDGEGFPRMVARADSTEDRLFICDGTNLYYYNGGETAATGVLTFAANVTAGDTVTIGTQTYTFVAALDSVGGAANDVVVGATADISVTNLVAAINATPTLGGVVYGVGTTANTAATAADGSGSTIDVTARLAGSGGTSIPTTESSATLSWGASTLQGGADVSLNTIATPDSVGIVSIDVLAQHVICVVSNSQRFYWIVPGAVVIDSLDFAEAEQQPDELLSVRVVGDVAWMLGESASEVWYVDPSATDSAERFVRQDGQAFSRGIVEGTDAVIDDTLIVVGDDQRVYVVSAGSLQAVSSPFISEKIRETV